MAELINKKDALAQIKSIPCATLEEFVCKELAESRIKRLPTTTEEKIRNRSIDEFVEKCNEEKWNYMNDEDEWQLGVLHGLTIAMRVAEQLKEE